MPRLIGDAYVAAFQDGPAFRAAADAEIRRALTGLSPAPRRVRLTLDAPVGAKVSVSIDEVPG